MAILRVPVLTTALGVCLAASFVTGCSSPSHSDAGDFNAICSDGSSCTLAHYNVDPIFGSNVGVPISVAVGSGAAPPLAVAAGTEIAIESADGTWSTEQVTGSNLPDFSVDDPYAASSVSLGLGADGTRWLAMFENGKLVVAHGAGSSWTVDNLTPAAAMSSPAYDPVPGGLVITSTGHVVVGYVAFDGVYLATWAGSAWTITEPISGGIPDTFEYAGVGVAPDPATNGTDVALAWQTADWTGQTSGGSLYYRSAGGSTEVVDPTRGGGTWVALAFDSTGHANIVYVGGTANHAARGDDGTWTLDSIPGGAAGDLVAGADGELAALVGEAGAGIGLAQRGSGSWTSQVLDDTCYLGGLAFSGNQLEIADCSGLLTPAGTYPADYMATCESDAQILCEAALACPVVDHARQTCGGTSCSCLTGSGGETCYWSVQNCEFYEQMALCGDSTSDPTKVMACAAALGSGISCSSGSTFVEIPDACQ